MVNLIEDARINYAERSNRGDFSHVHELASIHRRTGRWKPGREARCCAFCKVNCRFAWTTGHGVIKVIEYESADASVEGFSTSSLNSGRVIDCGSEVMSMEFAPVLESVSFRFPSTSLLAVGLNDGGIKIWNVETEVLVFHLSDHLASVNGLAFSSCGVPILVSCSSDKTLKVWDLADDGNMTLTMKSHKWPVLDCSFSPSDSHILASVGMGKSVIVWKMADKRSCKPLKTLKGHNNDVVSCSWSPDGALLATASHDTTAIIWDPSSGQQIMVLGHQYPLPSAIYAGGANGSWVTSVSFSKDGLKIATVCEDNRFRVWKPWNKGAPIQETTLNKIGYQCRFSPDGRIAAVGKQNGAVTLASDPDNDVLSLKHICRIAARRALPSHVIESLPLPQPIKDFLTYRSSLD